MSAFELIDWNITDRDCDMCANRERDGWWGLGGNTHCRGCHRTWKMTTKQAHCTACCAHFSSPSAFDLHLRGIDEALTCRDPGTVRNKKTGAYLLAQREDGVWTRPQTTDSFHTYPEDKEPDAE